MYEIRETKLGIDVLWGINVGLVIKVDHKYAGILGGLAGNFNGNALDELTTPQAQLLYYYPYY